jgi:hypothetical protein
MTSRYFGSDRPDEFGSDEVPRHPNRNATHSTIIVLRLHLKISVEAGTDISFGSVFGVLTVAGREAGAAIGVDANLGGLSVLGLLRAYTDNQHPEKPGAPQVGWLRRVSSRSLCFGLSAPVNPSSHNGNEVPAGPGGRSRPRGDAGLVAPSVPGSSAAPPALPLEIAEARAGAIMDTMRVTKKAWFGPKKYVGWGWSPRSPEGWAVVVAFLVLAVVSLVVLSNSARYISLAVLIVALLAVTVFTGDPPGGPSSKDR